MAVRSQLIDILSEHGPLSAQELDHAVRLHMERGGSFAEVLLGEALLDEEDLFFLMSRRLGIPSIPEVRLRHLTLSPELRRRVPRDLAQSRALVPLDLDPVQGRLSVAMFDPTDWDSLDLLRTTSRVAEIKCYLARRTPILQAVAAIYPEQDELSLKDDPPLLAAGGSSPGGSEESKVKIDPALAQEIAALEQVQDQRPTLPPLLDEQETPPLDLQQTAVCEAVQLPRPFEEGLTPVKELPDQKLLRRFVEEVQTNPFGHLASGEEAPLDDPELRLLLVPEEEEEQLDREPTLVTKVAEITDQQRVLPEVQQQQAQEALLRPLLLAVGSLTSMLEERIQPGQGLYREFGRLSRKVAQELSLDEASVSRVTLAAQLYALDICLRNEVGVEPPRDLRAAFGVQPAAPGGLGPSLRMLGASALGLQEDDEADPLSVHLIRMVADYLELKAESAEVAEDPETVAQLLRAGGEDPLLIGALTRVLEAAETSRVRIAGTEQD